MEQGVPASNLVLGFISLASINFLILLWHKTKSKFLLNFSQKVYHNNYNFHFN